MNPNDQLGADAPEADDLRATLAAAFRENTEADVTDVSSPVSDAPVAETDAQRAERIRDEQGRFAKAAEGRQDGAIAPVVDPAAASADPKAAAAPGTPEATDAAAAAATGPVRPPHGWSPAAKAVFDTLPAEVKDAVAKREAEVNKGFEKLADYKGLEPFADMAKQSGTTLQTAFASYRAAEDLLASNFAGGVSQLCQTFGKHPVEVAAGLLQVDPRALALALRGGQPAAQGEPQGQPSPQAPGIDPRLVQVLDQYGQVIKRLETAEERRVSDAQDAATRQTQSVIDKFFDDTASHPYAHNLEEQIVDLVSRDPAAREDLNGALRRAYETAVWMSPETRELAIKAQTATTPSANEQRTQAAIDAAKRARAGSRSLTGSPVAGADTAANAPAPTLREELRRSMASSSV